MRVVLVVHGYPPHQLGGTEVHTRTIARQLVARGHDVSVFAGVTGDPVRGRSVTDGLEEGVAVRRLSMPSDPEEPSLLLNRWVRAEFERLLDETHPDVVHIQHLLHLSGDLIETARRSVPTLVTLHDHWFQCSAIHPRPHDRHPRGRFWGVGCAWHHELRYPRRITSLAKRGDLVRTLAAELRRPRFLRRQLDFANVVLAPSQFILDAFIRFGVSREKLRLMPHGTHLEPARRDRKVTGPVRFGFVGSVAPVKGVHVLCEAFTRIGGDSTLHIHGPANDKDYLQQIERFLGPRIRYEGPFAPEDVERTYATFDVLVLPSLVHESFALTVAEAQACGLPVVASRVGALPERIAHGRDGLLVPPGNTRALSRALAGLEDPDEVTRLAKNVLPPRSMDSYADELESIYVGLAPRRAAPSSNHAGAASREVRSGG